MLPYTLEPEGPTENCLGELGSLYKYYYYYYYYYYLKYIIHHFFNPTCYDNQLWHSASILSFPTTKYPATPLTFFVLAFSHNVFCKKEKITTYCTSKDSCQNHFQPYRTRIWGRGNAVSIRKQTFWTSKIQGAQDLQKENNSIYNVLLPGYGRTHSPISLLPPCWAVLFS